MDNNIASERVRSRMSVDRVSEIIKVDASSMRRWEANGKKSWEDLVSLSTIYGCSIDYLLGLTDERIGTRSFEQNKNGTTARASSRRTDT